MDAQRTPEKFDIGEVAVCLGALSFIPYECTIVALPVAEQSLFTDAGNIWRRPPGHYLVECSDGMFSCWPWQLRKKKPPAEDRKVIRWDQCPFQPESINV